MVGSFFKDSGTLVTGRPTEGLRKRALDIAAAALSAADPRRCVQRHLRLSDNVLTCDGMQYDLASFKRVLIVGAGKASGAMAAAVEDLLGSRVTDGWVNVKDGYEVPTSRIVIHSAAHPEPDERSVRGSEAIVGLLRDAGPEDLVIAVLSGGGSSLLEIPKPGLTLEDLRAVTRLLLTSGATISEVNTVRRALSQVKGGRLADVAYPARVLVLVLSDVVGDDLATVASGPFFPSPTGPREAISVLRRYGLWSRITDAVRGAIEADEGRPLDFGHVHHAVVGNVREACLAAMDEARMDRHTALVTSFLEGEAREVGRLIAGMAKELKHHDNRWLQLPACVVLGGETTVTVRGQGRGGRNQEMALSAALGIDGLQGVVVLCIATDGGDGPTDAAGALIDGDTVTRAVRLGLDPLAYLADNDSYTLLKELGELVVTGPTGTNVNDLCIILADP